MIIVIDGMIFWQVRSFCLSILKWNLWALEHEIWYEYQRWCLWKHGQLAGSWLLRATFFLYLSVSVKVSRRIEVEKITRISNTIQINAWEMPGAFYLTILWLESLWPTFYLTCELWVEVATLTSTETERYLCVICTREDLHLQLGLSKYVLNF